MVGYEYPEVLTTAAIRHVRETVRGIFDGSSNGPAATPALGGPSNSCPRPKS